VVREQVDFAVPQLRGRGDRPACSGVDILVDAWTSRERGALQAMDDIGFSVKAKILSVESWRESVRADSATRHVAGNTLYRTARTRNYMDTQYPIVARPARRSTRPSRTDDSSRCEAGGWGAGCVHRRRALVRGRPHRVCLEAFLNRAGGLTTPRACSTSGSSRSCRPGRAGCSTAWSWRAGRTTRSVVRAAG